MIVIILLSKISVAFLQLSSKYHHDDAVFFFLTHAFYASLTNILKQLLIVKRIVALFFGMHISELMGSSINLSISQQFDLIFLQTDSFFIRLSKIFA